MNREPVAIIHLLAGLALLVIPVLMGFSIVHWTQEQSGLVIGLVNGAVVVLAGYFTRNNVVPLAKANEQIQAAIDTPKGTATVDQVIEKVENKNASIN